MTESVKELPVPGTNNQHFRQDNFGLEILDLATSQPLGQEVFDSIIFMSIKRVLRRG